MSDSIFARVLRRSLADDIIIYGGYTAYTSLLAFFPLLIFLMAVAGLFGSVADSQRLINYAMAYLPPDVVRALSPVLMDILKSKAPGLLTVGGLGTLWLASSGVEGVRYGLNKVYAVAEFRPWWKRRLQGLGVITGSAAALLLLTLAVIAWPLVGTWLPAGLKHVAGLAAVRLALAAVVLAALFGILYGVLPNRAQGWRQVWPGAALAVLLWLVLAQLFSVYLAHFNSYNATYGSIGGIIITLVFFQYSATVFLLGAELNILLEEKRRW